MTESSFSSIRQKWLLVFLWGILLTLACSLLVMLTLLFSSTGARITLFAISYFSPVSIEFQDSTGTLYSGIHISKADINHSVVAKNITISMPHITSPSLALSVESLTVNPNLVSFLSQLPDATANGLVQARSLTNISSDIDLFNQSVNTLFRFENLAYRLYIPASAPDGSTTIELFSNNDTEKLILTASKNYYNLAISGSLLLPPGEVFVFNHSTLDLSSSFPSGNLSGRSRTDQTTLDLLISPSDQNNHSLSLTAKSPHGHLNANGDIGSQSALELNFTYDSITLLDTKYADNSARITLNGSLNHPKVSVNLNIGEISSPGLSIDKISAKYMFNADVKTTVPIGKLQIDIERILNTNTIFLSKFSLQNDSASTTQFQFSARQDQSKIEGLFKLLNEDSQLGIQIDQLLLNDYALISDQYPQLVYLLPEQLSFSSKSPSFSLNGSFQNQDLYNLYVSISKLPTRVIPPAYLNALFPGIESVDGSLNTTVLLFQEKTNTPSIKGNFRFDVDSIFINSLLEDLPFDTSIHISGGQLYGTIDQDFSLSGILKTDRGELQIKATSANDFARIQGALIGSKFSLGGKKSTITINSNLDFTFEDRVFSLNGDILVDEAIYRLAFYKPASVLPLETTIQTKDDKNQSPAIGYKFSLNVDLGESTLVHVIGFHGKLTGNLNIRGSDSSQTLSSGTLSLQNGTLVIYRQSLPIDSLSLNWFNSAITNPDINLKIMTQGLRNIDGRDQMQRYGLRAYGSLEHLYFDYFSSPSAMNSFQIITALLTDSSFQKKSNVESLDQTLNTYHLGNDNSQLSEIADILNAIKSIPFFDNIDISEINLDESNDYVPEVNGVTITKRLDKYFALRYRMAPYDPRYNRISLDTNLSNNFILTSFAQNEGDLGMAINYSDSH